MQPLVTIVTPSLNQGHFLRATIESVLCQDYPHVEYIIMDGGSTDSTAAVAAEYGSRLTFISEKDNGQSDAINKGFRRARGEIVAWLNSDDILLEGAISTAVQALSNHPHAGAVYGEGYLIDREGNITGRFPYTQPFDLWRLTYLSDYILQQSVFFRRSVFDTIGYLREDLHYTMDWDVLIRIGKKFPVVLVPEFLGCLREYPEAKSFSGGLRRAREIRRILCEHTGLRFPPGWIVYGLDTYRQVWCERIRSRIPRILSPVAGFAEQMVTFGCGYVIGRTLSNSQGLYADGWAGPRVQFMLPAGDGALRIEGMLPGTGWLSGQTLNVVACGRSLGSHRVMSGAFSLEIPVPESLRGNPLDLEIRASHTFVPAYSSSSSDLRQLCYMLQRVAWSEPGDELSRQSAAEVVSG
jgi:glycosyltransferase involved in cell wall biosynthesis